MRSDVLIREATAKDAHAIVLLCRAGWPAWAAWFAPSFLVCRWWRKVIDSPICSVQVAAEAADNATKSVVGFSVLTTDFSAWDQILHTGPHSKVAKAVILLLHPSLLTAYIRRKKKMGAKGASKTDKTRCDSRGTSGYRFVERSAYVSRSSELHLALMGVDSQVRGKGIGSCLVCQYVESAEQMGVESVWLHVEPRNMRAQRLYQKHGFSIVGVDGSSLLMIRE